jgi:hypothetical protein
MQNYQLVILALRWLCNLENRQNQTGNGPHARICLSPYPARVLANRRQRFLMTFLR